jgi:hypothetical protein
LLPESPPSKLILILLFVRKTQLSSVTAIDYCIRSRSLHTLFAFDAHLTERQVLREE